MNSGFTTRTWQRLAICALVSIAIHVSADTSTQTPKPQASKKIATHGTKTPSSTAKHSSSTHASTQAPAVVKHSSSKKKRARGKSRATGKKHGQHVIDSERARQIQEALIREHYLDGAPTGTWDAATQAAMQRYQAAQGWQSKTTPDARALIKLGLGPRPEHLLNPESAMTSAAVSAGAASDPPSKSDPRSKSDGTSASPSGETPAGDPPQR